MALTTAGRNHIAGILIGEALTDFNNANAYLGIGDGVTAFNAAQTDLQGSSKSRKPMEATFPSRATNVLSLRAVWDTASGNHAWEEWGSFNASSSGTMLNRKLETLGTKTSAQTWQLSVSLTLVAA